MSSAAGYVSFSPALSATDACANYWLRHVTLHLRRELCWRWQAQGTTHTASADRLSESLDLTRFWHEKQRFFETDATARYLTGLIETDSPSAEGALRGSFGWVVQQLSLDPVAAFTLAMALVPALDNAAGAVIASCHTDAARPHPSLSLVQKLWREPEQVLWLSDSAHPLFRYGLLRPAEDWDAPLHVPSVIAAALLYPEAPLPFALTPVPQNKETPGETVLAVARRLAGATRRTLMVIREQYGNVPLEFFGSLAELTGRSIWEVRAEFPANAAATLAWLRGADLLIRGTEIPAESIPVTVFLAIPDRTVPANIPRRLITGIVDVPALSFDERVNRWKKNLGPRAFGLEEAIAECSRRFRYEGTAIDEICEALLALGRPLSERDLMLACRAELKFEVGDLAQRVEPRFTEDEVVLPPKQQQQFREIANAMRSLTRVHYGWGTARAWNEAGIAVLFAGPPGTGKTMAAEALANSLDLPMYRIDLSQVVNKYIGETEKNLKRIFDVADITDSLLFFDEADSLFGRRTETKDAHDRYANLEISYLLERMERFKGLAILATNRKRDLDEAFLRRLRYIVDFPMPGYEQRRRIWAQCLPANADCSGVDVDFLAKRFQLAGGHIRSIVFNACLQSAALSHGRPGLTMEPVLVAVKREYDKLGRSVTREQFGEYAAVIRSLEDQEER